VLLALAACSEEPPPPRAMVGDGASRVAERTAETVVAPLAVPDDAPLVAFLGDSIAAGLHLSADEAYPAVLQRELAADGAPFRLLNAGVSGDTSAGGLRRVDWLLTRKPALVVVELGGNDGLRGQEPAEIERNLRGIIEKCHAAGARVVLFGVQLPPSLGADYVQRFEAIFPRLAGELDVALVPAFMAGVGGVPAMNLEDGLHPTAEGHRVIARNARAELRRALDALAAH
jgi:acyl-CoA thioesterase I